MYKDEDGMHIYSGFFHFRGTFTGKDCFIRTEATEGEISVTAIGDHFGIGFRIAIDLAVFEDKDNLIQVEFEAKIPWLIDKTLESDC